MFRTKYLLEAHSKWGRNSFVKLVGQGEAIWHAAASQGECEKQQINEVDKLAFKHLSCRFKEANMRHTNQ